MRPVESVTVEPSNFNDGMVYKHPAFGQIQLHRLEGGHQTLYGSDFHHGRTVCISICTSELHRSLSHDWPHARKELIEVRMSEAQWATFVSSMNVGTGVQCTITARDNKYVPGFELPNRMEMFDQEMSEKLKDTIVGFRETLDQIDAMGLPKGKAAALKEPFRKAIQEMESNIPFVAKSFSTHMEKTVEKAKVEIHGYMNHTIQRAGLEALQEKLGTPLLIEKTDPIE